MNNVFRTYIVPAGIVTAARKKVDEAEMGGLAGMFRTALSPSGNAPITHYASSGTMSQEQADWVAANIPPAFDTSNGTLEVTNEDGSKSWVTEDGLSYIRRKNLKLVSPAV